MTGPGGAVPGKSRGPEVVVLDGDAYADAAAARIGDALRAAAREGRPVSLALAGGTTPRPVYRALARDEEIAWDRTAIFFGDERGVPPDHPESNYRMARETLLDAVPVDSGKIHRMEAERPDRERAAEEYEGLLPEALDVLLLGIGPEGHTASLFPGQEAVREEHRRVLPVDGPKEPSRRMTVTPPVLRSARRIFVLARGAEKARAVSAALAEETDPVSCPARLARGGVWILDPDAHSGLAGASS